MDVLSIAQELFELAESLKDRYDAFRSNPGAATDVLTACLDVASNLKTIAELDKDTLDSFPSHSRQIIQNEIDKLRRFAEEAIPVLRDDIKRLNNPLHAIGRAKDNESKFADMLAKAERAEESVARINGILGSVGAITGEIRVAVGGIEALLRDQVHAGPGADSFRPINTAPKNLKLVVIDFASLDSSGRPLTCEGKLKALVLKKEACGTVGAIAGGKGGVGKTCTLREIAADPDIKTRFPGGVYFLSLGKDGTIADLIAQLCNAVKASGGKELAATLRQERSLDTVIRSVLDWFGSHVCLFIIDDLWQSKGFPRDILRRLSVLEGNVCGETGCSRLLYSTRDENLARQGEHVSFEPREPLGREAAQILLEVADAEESEMEDPACRDAIMKILKRCAGLPLALNLCGKNVFKMRSMWKGDVKEAWNEYWKRLESRILVTDSSDIYGTFRDSLLVSLDFLESRRSGGEEGGVGLSFHEMFRALCVMKKQDWVPVSFLEHLWGLRDEKLVQSAIEEMDEVGVTDSEIRTVNGKSTLGLRLHDLVHDVAQEEAKQAGEELKWYGEVLRGYESEFGEGGGDICWAAGVEDDGYFLQNVCRLLDCAGRRSDVGRLLSSARWVVKMLGMNAILQLEGDVGTYLDRETPSAASEKNEEDALRQLCKIARMSLGSCAGNADAAWFQLYGRLFATRPRSEWVDRMMLEVEKWVPRPWLKTLTSCVKGADDSLIEMCRVPYQVREAFLVEGEGLMSCGFDWSERKAYVGRHSMSGESKFVELEMAEIPSEFRRDGSEQESVSESDLEIGSPGCLKRLREAIKALFVSCFGGQQGPHTGGDDGVTAGSSSEHMKRNWSQCGVISRDGRRVVMGFDDGTVWLWNTESGELVHALRGHRDEVRCVAISADGRWIASGSGDRTIRIWDTETGAQVGEALTGHTDYVRCVCMSPDGMRVVSGSDDKTVRMWDAQTGAQVGEALTGHTDLVWCVCMSADGRRVVSGSSGGTVRMWDAQTGVPVGEALTGHTDLVRCVCMSADGRRLVSGSWDNTVRMWDAQTEAQVGEALTGHTGSVWCVCMSADGRRVVSGSRDKTVRMWDAQTGAQVGEALTGHTDWVRCVCMSADGRRVVSGSSGGTVRMWDAQTGAQVGEALTGHTVDVQCVCMSADGSRVVSGSSGGTVRMWDAQTGAPVGEALTGHTDRVRCVCMSADGRRLVSGSWDNTVRMWDAQTEAQVGEALTGHTGSVWCVCMSADGRRVVSGSWDRTVRMWDAQTGAQVGEALTGHTDCVTRVGISGDGKRVLSGSYDGTARVWNDSGQCVHVEEDNDWYDRWDELCSRHLQVGDSNASGANAATKLVFSCWGTDIVLRRDGVEKVVASFEANISSFSVDSKRVTVVAGLRNGAVAILKVVR